MFQISKIDATINPPLFSLIDLMKDKVPGKFYKEQLLPTEKPDFKNNFFEIEKVLKEKTTRGKKFYLVKFMYYPSKFNEYIPEENMLFG